MDEVISRLPSEAFLVKDDSLKDIKAPFFKWLREKGYRKAWHKGHYGCEWVFVNITHKVFAYGMPGIKIVNPIGNHSIRIDEFMTIFKIYENYEEKRVKRATEVRDISITHTVIVTDRSEREKLIEMMEKDGFECKDDYSDRQEIVESQVALRINKDKRWYTLCYDSEKLKYAMFVNEFYEFYKLKDCTYEEYKKACAERFFHSGHPEIEDEYNRYFGNDEAEEFIRKQYEALLNGENDSNNVGETVSCLYMMM